MIDSPFQFDGTDLIRMDQNLIPLGLYNYQVVCKYDLEDDEYISQI